MIRQAMVRRYYELGNNASKTAREFNTKRQIVAKWVRRYEEKGQAGLRDFSRRPLRPCRHQTPLAVEKKIVAIVKAKKI